MEQGGAGTPGMQQPAFPTAHVARSAAVGEAHGLPGAVAGGRRLRARGPGMMMTRPPAGMRLKDGVEAMVMVDPRYTGGWCLETCWAGSSLAAVAKQQQQEQLHWAQ